MTPTASPVSAPSQPGSPFRPASAAPWSTSRPVTTSSSSPDRPPARPRTSRPMSSPGSLSRWWSDRAQALAPFGDLGAACDNAMVTRWRGHYALGGRCILFGNGPCLLVADPPAIENADRIMIGAWVNTLSWPGWAVVCRKDGSYILYNYSGGFSWYLFGLDNRLQYDIAGTLGSGS